MWYFSHDMYEWLVYSFAENNIPLVTCLPLTAASVITMCPSIKREYDRKCPNATNSQHAQYKLIDTLWSEQNSHHLAYGIIKLAFLNEDCYISFQVLYILLWIQQYVRFGIDDSFDLERVVEDHHYWMIWVTFELEHDFFLFTWAH